MEQILIRHLLAPNFCLVVHFHFLFDCLHALEMKECYLEVYCFLAMRNLGLDFPDLMMLCFCLDFVGYYPRHQGYHPGEDFYYLEEVIYSPEQKDCFLHLEES
eukprot:NODE_584_length_6418_cov_0.079601.p7 type:complete len:103 gc:universal NODE_584_length_6418_cov_0.079601:1686-1378(-)